MESPEPENRRLVPTAARWTPRWMRLAAKELREILRDRRTLLTLLLMPLLVYPLLGVSFQKVMFSQIVPGVRVEYTVVFETVHAAQLFEGRFRDGDRILKRRRGEVAPPTETPDAAAPADRPKLRFLTPEGSEQRLDVEEQLRERMAELGVKVVPAEGDAGKAGAVQCELIAVAGWQNSREAREYVEERLLAVNDSYARTVLREYAPQVFLPLELSRRTIAGESGPAISLAALAPLILILMTVTGAVYPAIDLTAGERERGTLEALISAPVPRYELLLGKYVAVLTVAILTAIANSVAMIGTLYSIGLDKLLLGDGGFQPIVFVQLFGLLVLFAGFFSAVLLILTSFARSFKEAQAYLIPLMLLSLAPGVFSLLPGLEFSAALAVTPLINIVVLARDLLDGRANPALAATAILSTALYTAGALAWAARVFGTDAMLYASEGTWKDWFRRPEHVAAGPTWLQGLFSLVVLFPAFILLGGLPARWFEHTPPLMLVGTSTVTILLFALWPAAFAFWTRIPQTKAFSLAPVRWTGFAGAALLGVSLWPWAYELEIWLLPADRLEMLEGFSERIAAFLKAVPLWGRLLALALVPAVCEELFFRGWLYAAIATRCRAVGTIVITGTLFGVLHVVVRDSVLWERFFPTCFLGLILGVVRWRTGSVLPGILLHVLHNGLLLSLSDAPEWITRWGLDVEGRQHLPAGWLIGAAVLTVAGGGLLAFSGKVQNAGTQQPSRSEPQPSIA